LKKSFILARKKEDMTNNPLVINEKSLKIMCEKLARAFLKS